MSRTDTPKSIPERGTVSHGEGHWPRLCDTGDPS